VGVSENGVYHQKNINLKEEHDDSGLGRAWPLFFLLHFTLFVFGGATYLFCVMLIEGQSFLAFTPTSTWWLVQRSAVTKHWPLFRAGYPVTLRKDSWGLGSTWEDIPTPSYSH
jgi:hypothetical protein